MPSKNQNQLNFFLLVKAFKEDGVRGVFTKRKDLQGFKQKITKEYIEKIQNVSEKIKEADLLDMTSGIEGDNPLGDNRTIKVGYWALFKGKHRTKNREIKDVVLIGQIIRVDNETKVVNFNINDIRNMFGSKIAALYRVDITDTDHQYLDYAHFNKILKTAKTPMELATKRAASEVIREEVRKILQELI
jgi:hypothetical protein